MISQRDIVIKLLIKCILDSFSTEVIVNSIFNLNVIKVNEYVWRATRRRGLLRKKLVFLNMVSTYLIWVIKQLFKSLWIVKNGGLLLVGTFVNLLDTCLLRNRELSLGSGKMLWDLKERLRLLMMGDMLWTYITSFTALANLIYLIKSISRRCQMKILDAIKLSLTHVFLVMLSIF